MLVVNRWKVHFMLHSCICPSFICVNNYISQCQFMNLIVRCGTENIRRSNEESEGRNKDCGERPEYRWVGYDFGYNWCEGGAKYRTFCWKGLDGRLGLSEWEFFPFIFFIIYAMKSIGGGNAPKYVSNRHQNQKKKIAISPSCIAVSHIQNGSCVASYPRIFNIIGH